MTGNTGSFKRRQQKPRRGKKFLRPFALQSRIGEPFLQGEALNYLLRQPQGDVRSTGLKLIEAPLFSPVARKAFRSLWCAA